MKKILVILSMLMLFGCGKKEEKEILIYTAVENHLVEEYVNEFNKEYPDIKLNIISGGTGDIIAKLIAEKNNPQADVVWSTSDIMILNEYNLLKSYKPKNFENIPNIFKDNEENPKWFGVSAWMVALGINTIEKEKLGLKDIESYYDILDSGYKNQVLMANPASSGTGYLTVNTFINLFGEENAWKYMDELHKNIAEYTASGNSPVQIVGRGEKIVGFIPAYQGIYMMDEGKLPMKVIFPKEGLGWELEVSALINKEKIKPEAKIFLDWTLSESGMKLHSKNRGFVTIKKYRNIYGYPKNLDSYLKERDFELELKNRDRILKEWERRYGKGEN